MSAALFESYPEKYQNIIKILSGSIRDPGERCFEDLGFVGGSGGSGSVALAGAGVSSALPNPLHRAAYEKIRGLLLAEKWTEARPVMGKFIYPKDGKGFPERNCFDALVTDRETDLMSIYIEQRPILPAEKDLYRPLAVRLFSYCLTLMVGSTISYGENRGRDLLEVIVKYRAFDYLACWFDRIDPILQSHVEYFKKCRPAEPYFSAKKLETLISVLNPQWETHRQILKKFFVCREHFEPGSTTFSELKHLLWEHPDKFELFVFPFTSLSSVASASVNLAVRALDLTPVEATAAIDYFFFNVVGREDAHVRQDWIHFLRLIAPPERYKMVLYDLVLQSGPDSAARRAELAALVAPAINVGEELPRLRDEIAQEERLLAALPNVSAGDLSVAQRKKEKGQAQLTASQREVNRLSQKVTDLGKRTEAARQAIENQLQKNEKEKKSLAAKLAKQQEKLAEEQKKLQTAQAHKVRLEGEMGLLTQDIEALKEGAAAASSTEGAEEKIEALSQAKAEIDARLSAVQAEIREYQAQLQAHQAAMERKRGSLVYENSVAMTQIQSRLEMGISVASVEIRELEDRIIERSVIREHYPVFVAQHFYGGAERTGLWALLNYWIMSAVSSYGIQAYVSGSVLDPHCQSIDDIDLIFVVGPEIKRSLQSLAAEFLERFIRRYDSTAQVDTKKGEVSYCQVGAEIRGLWHAKFGVRRTPLSIDITFQKFDGSIEAFRHKKMTIDTPVTSKASLYHWESGTLYQHAHAETHLDIPANVPVGDLFSSANRLAFVFFSLRKSGIVEILD